jgi:hypothetical protein
MYLSINQPIYDSTVFLLDLGCFSSFFILYTVGDSLDGGSPRRKAATYAQNNTNTE